MTAGLPRIVIHPAPQQPPLQSAPDADPLLAVVDLLRSTRNNVRAADVARALIAEGRAFAQTPSGRRWAALLSGSSIVENGWVLWHQANLDLSSADSTTLDSPSAMIETLFRRLTAGDLEKYVVLLGALLAEEASSPATPDCHERDA